MYMQVTIRDGEEGTPVEAFESFDADHVLGYVHADGSAVDMSAFSVPLVAYVSREVLDALPA